MRFEVIQCEICAALHNTRHALPGSWLTVKEGDSSEELHFCRDECVAVWLQHRGNAIAPSLEEQADCKARRFLLVDGETADITEGVKWGNGNVALERGGVFWESWEGFKSEHEGCGVQWIDRETEKSREESQE